MVRLAANISMMFQEVDLFDRSYLLDLIEGLGFEGWVGCEYHPRAGTAEGLGWAGPWGIRSG